MSTAVDRWRAAYGKRRFAVLLVLVILVIAVPSAFVDPGSTAGWFDGMTSFAVLAIVLSLAFERRQRLFALLFGVPTFLLSLGGWILPPETGTGVVLVSHALSAMFFFGSAVLIVNILFVDRSESPDAVFGAVCGYLFLGLGWAVLYTTTEDVSPGSFRYAGAEPGESPGTDPHSLTYFSLITLTTVGYGDVTPVSPTARTLAGLEAVAGQFYLAVIVAGLVGTFGRTSRATQQAGSEDAE